MPTYRPAFYREQGGDRAVVASTGSLDVESGGEIDIEAGGRLEIAGTAFITSGGGVNLASLTSGDVTLPGALTVSSGLAVTAASTFSAAVAFSSGIAVTGASTFSAGLTVSSGLLVSGASTFSTSVSIGGGLSVSSGITALLGVKQTLQAGTSSGGVVNGYGVSSIKSTAGVPVLYTIAPVTGYPKWIYCQASCATTGAAIVTTTGTWDGSNANALFSTGNTNRQWLHAVALSTAAWQVFGSSTDVTFTNT